MDNNVALRSGVTIACLIGFVLLKRTILFRIAKRVDILIGEKEIVFQSEERTFSLPPYLHIQRGEKKSTLLGIGDPPDSVQNYYSVNILDPETTLTSLSERKECIEAFFRTAFYQLFNRKLCLFILATVRGSAKFNRTLGNDYLEVVDTCLKGVGCLRRDFK